MNIARMQIQEGKRIKLPMLLAVCSLAAVSGCASLTTDSKPTKKKEKSWFSFKEKEYQIPQAMNVVWTYDILTIAGKTPTRGFGGRFYFYNEKTQAIPVDGELMVYGFDDTHGSADTADLSSAAKRFKFTAEQLTSHFSEGQLGASYSVWIPWDVAPGDEKKIMLIPTFIAKDGRMVKGSAATVNLPGRKAQHEETTIMQVRADLPVAGKLASAKSDALPLATASFSTPSEENRQAGPGVMTINLPNRGSQNQIQTPEMLAAIERLQATAQEQQRLQIQQMQLAQQALAQQQMNAGLPNHQSALQNSPALQAPSNLPNQMVIQPVFQPPQANAFPSGTNMNKTGPILGSQQSQFGVPQIGQTNAFQSIPTQ